MQFGPVSIGKNSGLRIGKKVYSWDEIEEIKINKGFLSIKQKNGGWFSGANASAAQITDLRVLLSILDQIIGIKALQ